MQSRLFKQAIQLVLCAFAPETATMSSPHSPRQNHVLAVLPEADYSRLLPDLDLIAMPLGWAVWELVKLRRERLRDEAQSAATQRRDPDAP